MDLAQKILALDEKTRNGCLRMFGEWFGRPWDNFYCPKTVTFKDGKLEIGFEKGEKLEVWDPSGFIAGHGSWGIDKASKVRWSWYHYGRPQSPETLRVREFTMTGSEIEFCSETSRRNHFSTDESAVEFL